VPNVRNRFRLESNRFRLADCCALCAISIDSPNVRSNQSRRYAPEMNAFSGRSSAGSPPLNLERAYQSRDSREASHDRRAPLRVSANFCSAAGGPGNRASFVPKMGPGPSWSGGGGSRQSRTGRGVSCAIRGFRERVPTRSADHARLIGARSLRRDSSHRRLHPRAHYSSRDRCI